MEPRKRHRWVKLRIHVYICRDCGMGRENSERSPGDWVTTFHAPTGESRIAPRVPPCVTGPRTAQALAKYATQIAEWKGHRHAIDMRPAAAASESREEA